MADNPSTADNLSTAVNHNTPSRHTVEDTEDHHRNRCSTPSLSSNTSSHNERARIAAAWEPALRHSAVVLFARKDANAAQTAASAAWIADLALIENKYDG